MIIIYPKMQTFKNLLALILPLSFLTLIALCIRGYAGYSKNNQMSILSENQDRMHAVVGIKYDDYPPNYVGVIQNPIRDTAKSNFLLKKIAQTSVETEEQVENRSFNNDTDKKNSNDMRYVKFPDLLSPITNSILNFLHNIISHLKDLYQGPNLEYDRKMNSEKENDNKK